MGAGEIKRWRRDLQSGQRQFRRDIRKATDRGRQRFERTAKENIIENDAVASTELFRGIDSYSTDGFVRGFNATEQAGARLLSRAPHSGYVEHGTGMKGDGTYPDPGNPSTVTIAQWMIDKPTMNPGTHLWPRARHIAQNISEEGVDSQPFFYDGVDAAMRRTTVASRMALNRAFGFDIDVGAWNKLYK